jgi:hypothetical protein
VTTLEELQRELMQAYEKKGQGLAEFSSEIKSLMDIGMSRERALVQLALENKIEIEDIKELEKRGLSKEEATREFCGKLKRTQELQSAYTSSEVAIRVKPSDAWYLMPILLGFLGGIVAYVYVRDDDLEMAKNLFFVGIIPTFIYIILGWMLFFL